MINIGAQKVFPADVESIFLEACQAPEATVYAVKNSLRGQVGHVRNSLIASENLNRLAERLRKHCLTPLARFEVPVRFQIFESAFQYGMRFKKIRTEELSSRPAGSDHPQ
jgi:long-chain acyl-CoA synthetase